MVAPPKLRVLRVIARTNVGGPAQHVAVLTTRLDPERFESLLAAGIPDPREGDLFALRPDYASQLEGRLKRVGGLGRAVNPVQDIRAAAALERLIRRFRPHIVHTHTAKAGALARPLARLHRVPVVVHTFHGTVFGGHFRPATARAVAAAERVLARFTDAAVAVSPAVKAELAHRGIAPGAIRVVPLGLDLAPFMAVPPITPDHRNRQVALVARLAPVKDVPLAIAAVAQARTRLPDLTLAIAGDGPLRSELERAAPSWVRFLGNVANVPGLMRESAAVVLSSKSEGSPVALIEALTAARPVAAVPVGGVIDLLSERPGAALARDRSPEALAAAVADVLSDPSYAAGAAAGRSRLADGFGADRLVADVAALYEELWAAARPGDADDG